jgi:hypothetical protein
MGPLGLPLECLDGASMGSLEGFYKREKVRLGVAKKLEGAPRWRVVTRPPNPDYGPAFMVIPHPSQVFQIRGIYFQ